MNLEPWANDPTHPHQNNPTANDRRAEEEGKKNLIGKNAKLKKDMQIKLQSKFTFNGAEKCETFDFKCQRARWSTDNSFNFHLFLKRMLWRFTFIIIQDFQRRQTELLQPN